MVRPCSSSSYGHTYVTHHSYTAHALYIQELIYPYWDRILTQIPNIIIDLARAKSEPLVNNTCKQKKIKSCNAKRERQ